MNTGDFYISIIQKQLEDVILHSISQISPDVYRYSNPVSLMIVLETYMNGLSGPSIIEAGRWSYIPANFSIPHTFFDPSNYGDLDLGDYPIIHISLENIEQDLEKIA